MLTQRLSVSFAEICKDFFFFLLGFLEAGAVFLLLCAPSASAPFGPDPAGLPEGPGAAAASRGAQPHPQDGAGVRQAGRSGPTASGGPGEESPTHQELGQCLLMDQCVKCDRCWRWIWVCFNR